MKIALVQMNCIKGNWRSNLNKMELFIDLAEKSKADFILFPEMSIGGYINPTKKPAYVFSPKESTAMKSFYRLTQNRKVVIMSGFIEKFEGNKPYISQVVVCNGKLLGIYRKRNIANEEVNWFSQSNNKPIFKARGIKFGISICADIKKSESFDDAAKQGAKIVFHAAAPGLYFRTTSRKKLIKGYEWWRGMCFKHLSQYAKKNKIYIVSASQVGKTEDEDFPGGMYVFSPDGSCIAQSNCFYESSMIVELS